MSSVTDTSDADEYFTIEETEELIDESDSQVEW